MRFVLLAVAIWFAVVGSALADENVRAVQEKLRDGGFYPGQIDGAYSSQLSAALTRYQIRNGLPITGQLDGDTSKALGAKPAVTNSATGPTQNSSETWRRLRRGEQRTSTSAPRSETAATEAPETSSTRAEETTEVPPGSAAAATAPISSESAKQASVPPPTRGAISTERLPDYVGAFVLAGLDPKVGSETEFFADRV